jgi:predicted transposase YbfD/YdcC
MQLFLAAFQEVRDPRADNVRHDLAEVLIVAFLAVLCGAQHCSEMEEFGNAKLKFLKRFLCLKHGIPSHDTFSTVFRLIDPKALDAAFATLVAAMLQALAGGGVIAIDGKSLKGAYDKGNACAPKMMVSAYATGLRMTLASVAADDGNEVEAALTVLGLIDLKGMIVTADALHCNRKMAAAITARGGDYCMSLKGNQANLLADAHMRLSTRQPAHPTARTETRAHGRIETRVGAVVAVKGLAERHDFPGLTAFGRIEATRNIDGKSATDVRIFALSRRLEPAALLAAVRAHWEIENVLHWSLDVAMREDAARNRKDHGPANLAVFRRRALDVARADKKTKGSVSGRLKRAGWNDAYLLKLLRQMR